MSDGYSIVQLANGAFSLRSASYGETFHPVVGPEAEAQALYIRQLNLLERIAATEEEFVVWDVGLGAAGNPLTFLRAAMHLDARVRIISFDNTDEPFAYAIEHGDKLGYMDGFEPPMRELLRTHHIIFPATRSLRVDWSFHLGDFPAFLESDSAVQLPKPHAIFYDAFSPAKNPAMWTLPVFKRLFQLLDPGRPCSMPTYSRSTLLRVTLLLAGFYVGVGHATGEKEETTIAANARELITEPLRRDWLMRARRSRSAEPLVESVYTQAPITEASWERLQLHPQFRLL